MRHYEYYNKTAELCYCKVNREIEGRRTSSMIHPLQPKHCTQPKQVQSVVNAIILQDV